MQIPRHGPFYNDPKRVANNATWSDDNAKQRDGGLKARRYDFAAETTTYTCLTKTSRETPRPLWTRLRVKAG